MYDPVEASFEAKDAADYAWEMSRPVCDYCGEHIQEDKFWIIEGKKICESCLNESSVWTEDYSV